MEGTQIVDEAVVEALPQGAKVVSVTKGGASDWTTTSCISVLLPDQKTQKYFLKCAVDEIGKTMLLGEYTASTHIYNIMPSFIPKPQAWGKLRAPAQNTYFFLTEYRDISPTPPDPEKFIERLVAMHRKGTSENGMFGFPVTTCDGALPHTVAWQKNWGVFYGELIRGVLKFDTETNGSWSELDAVFNWTISHVIPRLLGALQSEGRELRPALIHGDMYHGNYGVDLDTGDVIVFDASSYYAHNEMELGLWRWGDPMKSFTERYLRHFDASEPKDEWDDRNRLYSVKTKLNFSADHPGDEGKRMRRVAYEDLCYLCRKYAPAEPVDS